MERKFQQIPERKHANKHEQSARPHRTNNLHLPQLPTELQQINIRPVETIISIFRGQRPVVQDSSKLFERTNSRGTDAGLH